MSGDDPFNRPTITFGEYSFGLGWTAYDGCNWTSGRARVQPSGAFSTSHRVHTLIGCVPGSYRHIANVEVCTRAVRLSLSKGRLLFYDPAGDLLGAYNSARPGL